MGRKRRPSEATRLDVVDRSLYTSFCTAANSLSHLYTQSMNLQRLSFQAGERHSLEKLHQWILRQQEGSARVSPMDIVSYLLNELDAGIGNASMSPRVPVQHQHSLATMHLPCPGSVLVSSGQLMPTAPGQGFRPVNPDRHKGKDAIFSDALSSPVHRSLQHYHLTQGGYDTAASPSGNRRNNEGMNPHHPTREANPTTSSDTAVDMNAVGRFADSLY